MEGKFWELVGRDKTSGRVPGSPIGSNPAGPDAAALIHFCITEMWQEARPVLGRATDPIALTSGSAGPYNLPTDFLAFFDNEPPTIAGQPVYPRKRNEVRQIAAGTSTQPATTPCVLYEIGRSTTTPFRRRFQVWPLPGSSMTLDLDYLRTPLAFATLAVGDEYPDLPADLHLAPVYGAACLFFDNNDVVPGKDYAMWQNRYERGKARLKLTCREELQPAYQAVVPNMMSNTIMDRWMPVE